MRYGLDTTILETLDRWEKESGLLPEILKLYRDVLHIQLEVKNSLVPLPVSTESIQKSLEKGIPQLSFDDLGIDQLKLTNALIRISLIMEQHLTFSENDLEWLGNLGTDGALLDQTARNWYGGTGSVNQSDGFEREVIATTMQTVLWPWLRIQAESLSDKLDTSKWRRPYCPVCGGKPDFAYLAKDDGSRLLSCFRCDSEWLFQRLECPFCGNVDQKELACFSDDLNFRRVEVCHKCGTYVRSIDLRKARGEVLIPLEKVMAVNLSWKDQDDFRPGWI